MGQSSSLLGENILSEMEIWEFLVWHGETFLWQFSHKKVKWVSLDCFFYGFQKGQIVKEGCTRTVLYGSSHSQLIHHLHEVHRSITLLGDHDKNLGQVEPKWLSCSYSWQCKISDDRIGCCLKTKKKILLLVCQFCFTLVLYSFLN